MIPDTAFKESVRVKKETVEGGCFCGEVRYRASSRPPHSMICHCRTCQAIAASPVVAWVTFAKADFQFVKGHPSAFRSSGPVQRTFCGKCGTPLTYEHDESPEFIDVTTCSLDAPEAFPPTHHSWLGHNIPWVRFGDDLPKFEQSRNDDAPPKP